MQLWRAFERRTRSPGCRPDPLGDDAPKPLFVLFSRESFSGRAQRIHSQRWNLMRCARLNTLPKDSRVWVAAPPSGGLEAEPPSHRYILFPQPVNALDLHRPLRQVTNKKGESLHAPAFISTEPNANHPAILVGSLAFSSSGFLSSPSARRKLVVVALTSCRRRQ